MEMCLGDQQYITLLFYLDVICVFSSTVNKMLDKVALVLGHLKEFNLKLNQSKHISSSSQVWCFLVMFCLRMVSHLIRKRSAR